MPLTTAYQDLTPFGLADGSIRLTGLETFDEPGSFIGLVSYTINGTPGPEALRLDFGKICFLDIEPFEAAHGEAEGRRRANALAEQILQKLSEPQLAKASHGD